MTKEPRQPGVNLQEPLIAALVVIGILVSGIGSGALLWRAGEGADSAALDASSPAQLVSDSHDTAGLLLVAAENLAQERGLTYTALRNSNQISEQTRNSISVTRETADRALNQALNLIVDQLKFDRNTSLMQSVSNNIKFLLEKRAEIDHANYVVERTNGVLRADQWFAASSRVIVSAEKLLELVHAKIKRVGKNEIDSPAALKLQRLAMLMIDFVGRERAVVSGAISANANLNDSFSSWILPAYRERINAVWMSIKGIADSNALSPEATTLIAKIERDYFEHMEQLRETIQKARKEGSAYPVTAREWFETSSLVIQSVVALGEEAGQLARRNSNKCTLLNRAFSSSHGSDRMT